MNHRQALRLRSGDVLYEIRRTRRAPPTILRQWSVVEVVENRESVHVVVADDLGTKTTLRDLRGLVHEDDFEDILNRETVRVEEAQERSYARRENWITAVVDVVGDIDLGRLLVHWRGQWVNVLDVDAPGSIDPATLKFAVVTDFADVAVALTAAE